MTNFACKEFGNISRMHEEQFLDWFLGRDHFDLDYTRHEDKRSEQNKKNRSKLTVNHAAGSRSFQRTRACMERIGWSRGAHEKEQERMRIEHEERIQLEQERMRKSKSTYRQKYLEKKMSSVMEKKMSDMSKRLFSQFGAFCYINEINGASNNYCDASNTQYPCNPSQQYYGRRPLQLTWNYNYGAAESSNGFDGLNSLGTVGTDPIISFKTALWFWMNNVHQVVIQEFGATIRAINGAVECNGGNSAAVQSRIQYYTQYCNQFGVAMVTI
ncbi:Chitinase 5 [Morella rubra]|uniref:chitinase n=1 Tax=Morella rubra TaxID=262757 RepID=A0A6A1VJP2_9ROSI|nr:Chitinase 5 [Morella rubra]